MKDCDIEKEILEKFPEIEKGYKLALIKAYKVFKNWKYEKSAEEHFIGDSLLFSAFMAGIVWQLHAGLFRLDDFNNYFKRVNKQRRKYKMKPTNYEFK